MARNFLTAAELEDIANASDFYDDIEDEILSESEDEILEDLTDVESSSSDPEGDSDGINQGVESILAKDGTLWEKSKPSVRRRCARNILIQKPGRTNYSANFTTKAEAFKLFFSDEIIEIVIRETNNRAHSILGDKWVPVNKEELYAFIGLLLIAGCFKANHEPILELWSTKNPAFQRPIFRATMSRNRMKSLLRFIRFDDMTTRPERRVSDKLAAIREIHDLFTSNCKNAYIPNHDVCVDEQLVPFRGRCPFRVYMKSKPDKYGIKIWALCDSSNIYCWNLQVYTGMTDNKPEKEQGKRVVMDLVDGLGSGYGVTTDNFFTSLLLSKELLQQSKTLTGTIRKNRKEVPKQFIPHKNNQEYSSDILYTKDTVLVSYVPKKNRSVLLLSTQHCDLNISGEETAYKPQVILDYNRHKGAVDSFDKMAKEYSSKRNTKRWPLVLFFNFIDIGGINAFVLYVDKYNEYEKGKSFRRRLFLQDLGLELVTPFIKSRPRQGLHKHIQAAIDMVLMDCPNYSENPAPPENEKKRGRCKICSRSSDRKFSTKCDKCKYFVCKEHSNIKKNILCNSCKL